MSKLLGNDLLNSEIIFGPDSFIRNKPNGNDLDKYYSIQNEEATKAEKMYKDKLVYSFEEDEDGNIQVKYKIWNYSSYVMDLQKLCESIMNQYSINNKPSMTEEVYMTYYYKAKVVAMKILSDNLDNYNDNNEYTEVIKFNGDKIEKGEYYNLYISLTGKKIDSNDNESRVNDYLSTAQEKGLYNPDDPLTIK